MNFNDIIRMQKKLPVDCPLRLAPILNDPLAFIGEANLAADAKKLKALLSETSKGDPALLQTIAKIDQNLILIKDAENALKQLEVEVNQIFDSFECTATGSLFQDDKSIANVLRVEAFKPINEIEILFQTHCEIGRKTVWAHTVAIVPISHSQEELLKKEMKKFDLVGWNFKELPSAEGKRAFALEKRISPGEDVKQTLEDGRKLIKEIEKKLI